MRQHRAPWMRRAACGLAAVLAVAIAACGGASGGGAASTGGAAPAGGAATSGVAAAQAKVDRLYAGSFGAPPASAPKAQPGKDVWIISASQAGGATAIAAAAAQRAAGLLGWRSTIFDGKGDPSVMLSGIRSAIAAGADAIFLYSIDCASVRAGLEQAKRAHIPTVAAEGADCDAVQKGAPSLFTYVVHYGKDDTPFLPFLAEWGAAQADWDIVQTQGRAKIIDFREVDLVTNLTTDAGFRRELATCAGCAVVDTVTYTLPDLGPNLQEKAQQALLKHPEATGVEVPYDAVMTSGVSAALRSSGRLGQMRVMGGEGNPANMNLIRQHGGQDAGVGLPPDWEGWAAMDAVNRIFDHQAPVTSGIGLQLFDARHNMPATGGFVPMRDGKPLDYAGAYRRAFAGG